MNGPLVSIITPAYNASAFIRATVESVLAQTYRSWELLVADDCSLDRTAETVREYSARDDRVRLISMMKNQGPAAARQTALEQARGRLIAFLDADDLWVPEKLSRQLKFMIDQGAGLSFTAFRRMSSDGASVGRLIGVPARLTYAQLLGNTAIATSTAMVDRGVTGNFRMIATYYDDFALWLEITRRGFPAFGLNEDLMRYRVLGGSVSRNKGRSARMVWRTYRDVEKLPLLRSAWCFARYAINAAAKYRSF
jgi:teichuronic acid biosynthesis glycosyltransferase TuaG